ncbi:MULTISPECIES: outer membrane protein assembly factor BamB family protein [Streptomyces]|uniref:outer membrane protein assembly factor BamB family protein n=1 Tax=Streptomyces TaxID=1883 RepID=UPI0022489979|nr:PQQ-binding-like beta-propeller repeat protein [Streptomyces sp. JHD 1]MCX2968130.1 PQQ-binding-like beta-propeller repeat protein [Streptomyces sp. JHD 1]
MSQPPPPSQPPNQPPEEPPADPSAEQPRPEPGRPDQPPAAVPPEQPPAAPPAGPPAEPAPPRGAPGAFGAPPPQRPGYGYPAPPSEDHPSPHQPPRGTPPPPPGQAPAAGFGAPQAPGPHPGSPDQPTAPQPGYGYPGQDSGAYQQPAQPGPYGAPTPPGAYPPPGGYPPPGAYGQPGQPGQPHQTVPGAPRAGGSYNKKLVAIVASVVAVAVIAVGGIALLSGQDSENESKGDGKGTSQKQQREEEKEKEETAEGEFPERTKSRGEFAFKVDGPKNVPAEILMSTAGFWTTDEAAVKYEHDAVRAYDTESGEELWTIDAVRGEQCAAAPQSAEGKTMVLWGRKCEKAMGIDLVNGKALWKQDLPAPEGADMADVSYPQAAVSGDIGAVAWIGGHAAYDLTTGDLLWKPEEARPECKESGYVGGEQLIALVECGFDGPTSLRSVDAEGKKKHEWKAPDGTEIQRVFSTSPLVVGVNAGGSDSIAITDLFVLSDTLEYERKISIDEDRFRFRSVEQGLADTYNVVVDSENDLVYLETDMHQSGDVRTNEVVSYDLGTGKLKQVFEHGENGGMTPIAVRGGKVLAYRDGGFSEPGALRVLDPATGKAEPYMEMPKEEEELVQQLGYSTNTKMVWANDTLFFVTLKIYRDESLNNAMLAAVR